MSDASTTTDLTLDGLVHDLNNVFETISEAAELVSSDPQWSTVAAAITRSVERGKRIVGSYAGQNRSGADLDLILDRAATFLQDSLRLMPGAKVRLQRRLPSGLRLHGEPGDWERVFMNLFLNAAQAMRDSGGGEIEITGSINEQMLEIRIQDNGPGIPESILPRIFKPRFSTRNQHTGLGLHIVHTLVQQNSGTVRAANRTGQAGAIFTLTTPLMPPGSTA